MSASTETRTGIILAVLAYVQWGLAPFYFKLIQAVPSDEILVHRIVWSFFLLVIIAMVGKHWQKCRVVLANPKLIGLLVVTSMLLAANWFIFIWAINSERLLDASLGYYINPLFSVALGMFFFAERLRTLQWFAVGLAFTGVTIQIVKFGAVPWIALGLALTFGLYGMLRKKLPVDAVSGLLLESLVLMPIAIIYWFGVADSQYADLTTNTTYMNLLLISASIVTTLPLLCFTAAAKRLQLSTLGFFQYIGPSIMFVLAVFLFDEAFTLDKSITFGFIWAALLVFTLDALKNQRQKRKESKLASR